MVEAVEVIVVAGVTHTWQFGVFDAPVSEAKQVASGSDSFGGCAALPMSSEGPQDPTLMAMVTLAPL